VEEKQREPMQRVILQQLSSDLGWRYVFNLILMIGAYIILALLSPQVFTTDPYVPTIWLPTGLMLAVVLIGGYQYLVGVAISVFIISLLREHPLHAASLIAMVSTCTIFVDVYLLTSVFKTDLRLKRVSDLFRIVMVGGFGSMFPGALIGTVLASLDNVYSPGNLVEQFFSLWFGTSLSVVFITPLILAWYHDRRPVSSSRRLIEMIGLLATAMLLNGLAFSDILQLNATVHIFYMILPPIIWAIARFELREVTLINAIMIGFVLWSCESTSGFIHTLPVAEQLAFTWSLIGVGTVIILTVKLLFDERNDIALTLRKERDAMTQILDNLGQGVTVVSKEGLYEYVNPAFAELVGIDNEDLIGTSPYNVIADSFKPELDEIFKQRKRGEPSSYQATLKHRNGDEIIVMTTGVPRMIDGKHEGSISVLTDIRPLLQAQAAQRKSEAEFQQLFDNTEVGMYRCKPGGYPIAINQTLAELSGYSSVEAFFESHQDSTARFYVDPNRWDEFIILLEHAGKVSDFESEVYQWGSQETLWIRESAYAVYDDNGEMEYYEGTVVDITERKHFEQELQRSEALFRTVFENSADGIVVVNHKSQIIMSNRAHEILTGYNARELSNMEITAYIHPDDVAREEERFQKAIKNRDDSYDLELRYIHKNGETRWISASVGLVWDENDRYQYAIGISRDITEARAIQLEVAKDEKRFRAVFENASLPIAVTRADRRIGMVNPAFSDMLGYTADELQNMRFDDITYPGDNEENIRLLNQLVNHEIDTFIIDKRYVHKDGSIVWANITVSRFEAFMPDENDDRLYSIAIIENITERKLAEARLFAEMHLNEQMIDALPGIFYFFDQNNRFLRWNKELEQLRGFSSEDMENVLPIDFFPAEIHDEVRASIQEVFDEGYTVREFPMLNQDGSTTLYLMNGYRMMYEGEPCLLGVGIDISDLKQTELALRESEERYRTIFENSLVGMYRTSADGRIISANPALAEILGYDSVEDLYKLDLAKDLYLTPDERDIQIKRSLNTSTGFTENNLTLRKKNGDTIIAGIRSKAYYDEDGELLYFEGSMRDVTEKVRYDEEIQRLNKDLEQRVIEATRELREKNEKLLELDRLRAKFIADMSHEMRTPLAVLNTRLYLLKNSKDISDLGRHIQGLQLQIDRMSEFVENAFDLSVIDMSRHNITFDEVMFNEIVEQAVQALQPRADVGGLGLQYTLDANLPPIIGVESHLSQVVTNLVSNAIKYTSDGSITVTTGRDSITNRVYLRVEDTGMGIAPEDKDYLFSRFYRGERAGQSTIPGTGLGLSIVKEIVDAHDGHIDVESEVNAGTIFTVWLPIKPMNQPVTEVTQDDADATVGE